MTKEQFLKELFSERDEKEKVIKDTYNSLINLRNDCLIDLKGER